MRPSTTLPANPPEVTSRQGQTITVATDLHFFAWSHFYFAVTWIFPVKSLQTISRAILTFVMASSFLVMSFAAGAHELSHLRPVDTPDCSHTGPHGSIEAATQISFSCGTAVPLQWLEGMVCFFCTHTPSIIPVAGKGIPETVILSHEPPVTPVSTSLQGNRITPTSPRAPPFLG